MQTQAPENVTTTEPNEQADTCERQPYQAPHLIKLDLTETLASIITLNDGGAGLS